MAEEKNTYEVLPENYEEDNKKKKKKKKGRPGEMPTALIITTLMDILTVLLMFLLKTYATDPIQFPASSELQLPKSTTNISPSYTVTILVSKTAILVDNEPVLAVKDGKVDGSLKRGGDDAYFITPLSKALADGVEKIRRLAAVNPSIKFEGVVTIVMDGDAPYRLLTEVMYTAGQAEFSKFKFAVVSTSLA